MPHNLLFPLVDWGASISTAPLQAALLFVHHLSDLTFAWYPYHGLEVLPPNDNLNVAPVHNDKNSRVIAFTSSHCLVLWKDVVNRSSMHPATRRHVTHLCLTFLRSIPTSNRENVEDSFESSVVLVVGVIIADVILRICFKNASKCSIIHSTASTSRFGNLTPSFSMEIVTTRFLFNFTGSCQVKSRKGER